MRGRIDADLRPEQNVIADRHGANIQNHAVEVRVKMVPDGNIAAVITAKVRLDVNMFPNRPKHFFEKLRAVLEFILPGVVVCPQQSSDFAHVFPQLFIAAVRHPPNHSLFHAQHIACAPFPISVSQHVNVFHKGRRAFSRSLVNEKLHQ